MGEVVHEAVCSPIRNLMPQSLRRGQQLATSRPGELAGSVLARLARASKPEIGWRITRGPWFQNMLSTLAFDGRTVRIGFERTAPDLTGTPHLQPVCDTELS
jgi:hypothetical protein